MTTIATYIRDAAYQRLLKIAPWNSTRTVPIPPLQANLLPALGVFITRESMSPDGDSNVGPPRYISDAIISFTVTDLASKADVLAGSVDDKIDLIQDTLLCDSTFIDLRDQTGEPVLDSIPNVTRTYNFPSQGETLFLEARVQMTFRFRCFFEPAAPNLLRTVMVTVQPNGEPVPGGDPLDIELTG